MKGNPNSLNCPPLPEGVRKSLLQLGARIAVGAVTELEALDLFEVVASHAIDGK